VNVDELR